MAQAIRIIHGSSAALASALPALARASGIRAIPSFSHSEDDEGSELAFISVRLEAEDWEEAAARVESLLPANLEYFLTTDE